MNKTGILSSESLKQITEAAGEPGDLPTPSSSFVVVFAVCLFFHYESMITHLQETRKIQNKVTYSSTQLSSEDQSTVVHCGIFLFSIITLQLCKMLTLQEAG